MRVGFTGARDGMNPAQYEELGLILRQNLAKELHHGDCIGADSTAHSLALQLGLRVIIHPPVDTGLQAHCNGAHEMREPKTHFARNRAIVNETQVLIATPKDNTEQAYGGTWYTVRYARKLRRPIVILLPNGNIVWENDWMAHQSGVDNINKERMDKGLPPIGGFY